MAITTKPALKPKPVTPAAGPLNKPRITAAQAMAGTLAQVQQNAVANGQTWLGVGPGDQAWDKDMAKAVAANPQLGTAAAQQAQGGLTLAEAQQATQAALERQRQAILASNAAISGQPAPAEPAYLGAPTDASPRPPNNLMAIADALYTPNGQAAAAVKPTAEVPYSPPPGFVGSRSWVDKLAGTRSEGWRPAYSDYDWAEYMARHPQNGGETAVPPVEVSGSATATTGGTPPPGTVGPGGAIFSPSTPVSGGVASGPLDQNYTSGGLQAQELAAAAAYQRALAAQETATAQNQLTTLGLNRTAAEGASERDLWDQQRQLGAQFGQLGTVRSGAYQRQASRSVEDNLRDRTAVLQQYQQEMARLQTEVQQGIRDRSEAAIAQQQAQIRTAWAMSQLGDIG